MKRVSIYIQFFILIFSSLQAQNVEVKSEVDRKEIKVGEQIVWKISATQDDKTSVSWPVFQDKVGDKFEIVRWNEPDTVFSDDKSKITFSQEYILTSFDSGFFSIPPVQFLYTKGDDTLYAFTDSLMVSVSTVPVDTTKQFYDITGPVDAPFSFREILPYVIVAIVIVILGLVIFYFVRRALKKRRSKLHEIVTEPEAPKIPAHILAIERFNQLKSKKLWQQGKIKEYYSELTDIVRLYIHDRYFIDASEMTTDEIISKIQLTNASDHSQQKLSMLLRMADLVKFAKAKPNELENEEALENAEQFVELTKVIDTTNKE